MSPYSRHYFKVELKVVGRAPRKKVVLSSQPSCESVSQLVVRNYYTCGSYSFGGQHLCGTASISIQSCLLNNITLNPRHSDDYS